MYEKLGFKILPFELENREKGTMKAKTPREEVMNIINLINEGKIRHQEDSVLEGVSKATRQMYQKYKLAELIQRIHADPLGGEDGNITETREYIPYIESFDQ